MSWGWVAIRPSTASDAAFQYPLIDRSLLPTIPSTLEVGEPLFFYRPPNADLLSMGTSEGLVVRIVPPGMPLMSIVLAEGEATTFEPDVPGLWIVEVVLLANGLCSTETADAVVVQSATIDVN